MKQDSRRVAIQGYEGSFHQAAANAYFGKGVVAVPCSTFREVIRVTNNRKESDAGIMAIENSIAGSILPNYSLIQKSGLSITGEIYLRIRQNLVVNPGVKLEDIREVHSHPMAIQQCLEYLDERNWKLIETEDTALSAKQLRQHRSRHIAGIASNLAAQLFGLEVLARNIHTAKNNYTRFLVLERKAEQNIGPGADKASVNFHTDHTRGSLARVLTIIAAGGVNLSKLQSFPIPGSAFRYSFHADMEFESIEEFQRIIEKVEKCTRGLMVYGVYKRGRFVN